MKIQNVRQINSGALQLSFDCKIPAWGDALLCGCTLFEKGSQRWINAPCDKVEKDGETKYYARVRYEDKDKNDAFKKKILEALDKHLAEQGGEEASPDEDLPF